MARTVVRGVVDVLEAVNKRISFLFDIMIISNWLFWRKG
jgi:hypothetical protein